MEKSKLYGKEDSFSKTFDDLKIYESKNLDMPVSLTISTGDVLDAVGFGYKKDDILLHGGDKGEKKEYRLAPDEFIIKVTGTYTSNYYGASALLSLIFYTNKGKSYGGEGKVKEGAVQFEYNVSSGCAIGCIFGSVSEHTDGTKYVASIGFYETIIPETYTITIPAGPLWSNDDAQLKAPYICAAHGGKFDGVWSTVVRGKMSVINCVMRYTPPKNPTVFKLDVPAGPIWSNEDAKEKCEAICASYGGKWTGQWKTIIPNRMSVCECEFSWE